MRGVRHAAPGRAILSPVAREVPRGRRRAFVAVAAVLACAIPLAATEIALRIFPIVPKPRQLDILIEPGGKYQAPDPELGFTPLPGRYEALFDHKYPWSFTNLPDTTRITKPLDRYGVEPPKPGIWIFGCSFTQGWRLNDEDTMSWKLQQRLPDHDVVNFGVGGYGTLQSLLQYRRALKDRSKPQIAILVYADFHDERNVRTGVWRDANFSYERFGTTAQPYARLNWSGDLSYRWGSTAVPLMELRARSVAFNAAVIGYGRVRDAFLDPHTVSELLIQQFVEESRSLGVQFVLTGIWPSAATRETLTRFAGQGVPSIDISVDQSDRRNRIPNDGHPSAIANGLSADKLAAALRTLGRADAARGSVPHR